MKYHEKYLVEAGIKPVMSCPSDRRPTTELQWPRNIAYKKILNLAADLGPVLFDILVQSK